MNKAKEIMARILNVKLLLGMLLISMATNAWADLVSEPIEHEEMGILLEFMFADPLIRNESFCRLNLFMSLFFILLIFLWYFVLYRFKTIDILVSLIIFILFLICFVAFLDCFSYFSFSFILLYSISFVVMFLMIFVSGILVCTHNTEKSSESRLKRWLTCGPTWGKSIILLLFAVIMALLCVCSHLSLKIDTNTHHYEQEKEKIKSEYEHKIRNYHDKRHPYPWWKGNK